MIRDVKADILFHVLCRHGRGLYIDFNTVPCVSCDACTHMHVEAALLVLFAAGLSLARGLKNFNVAQRCSCQTPEMASPRENRPPTPPLTTFMIAVSLALRNTLSCSRKHMLICHFAVQLSTAGRFWLQRAHIHHLPDLNSRTLSAHLSLLGQ